jgi:hypothetical protein
MMPSARHELLNAALGWVNHMRHRMGANPIDTWPKSIPGSENNCLIARAIRHDNDACMKVRIGSDTYMIEYREQLRPIRDMHSVRWAESGDPIRMSMDYQRSNGEHGELPHPCKKVVRMFDNGDLPEYIDEKEYRRRNEQATPPHLKGKLIDYGTSPLVHAEPGALTATMVHKSMEELWKSLGQDMMKPPSALAALCPVPAFPQVHYKAPDWASMLQSPEAPVKVLEEEPITV